MIQQAKGMILVREEEYIHGGHATHKQTNSAEGSGVQGPDVGGDV